MRPKGCVDGKMSAKAKVAVIYNVLAKDTFGQMINRQHPDTQPASVTY